MEVNPLNIFFVKSDSKGDRLLFRYPYATDIKDEGKQKKCGRNNAYAIPITEDLLQSSQPQTSNICKGQLSGFTDEMLSTLFAVKAELCNIKFELKVNDVRFVGHPTLLPYRSNKDDSAAMILINIVFALQASASHSIVKCYYDLSKRLGKALRHEERRCSYLTEEMKIMLAAHDEVSAMDEGTDTENDLDNFRHSFSSNVTDDSIVSKSPFHLILQRSSLARSMKDVFEELSSTGIVQVRINKWVLLSFCLPHKAHQIHNRGLVIEPETIDKCLQKLRPYHGMLLMVNPNDLLESIPLDGNPALLRLIKLYSPLKSLQTLAIEADLMLSQVFQLTGHLVYWAKATVIYPLCEGNVYVVAPCANIHINSPLVDEFSNEFSGLCLLQVLGNFSLPAPLWYHARGGAGGGADVTRLPRVVAWLLRRRLLLQLHTYVQFNSAHWGRDIDGKEYYCEKHNEIYNQSCNVSFSSLNISSPVEQTNVNISTEVEEEYPTINNLNQTDFSHTKPIIIESDKKSFEVDSANHSFDGVDEVDTIITKNNSDFDTKNDENKHHTNSVDSGFSTNMNGKHKENGADELNGDTEKLVKKLPTRLSDISLKDVTNDNDRIDKEDDKSPKLKVNGQMNGSFTERKNGLNNIRLDMSFQPPTVWGGGGGCDDARRLPPVASSDDSLLDAFTSEERTALATLYRAPEDLALLAQLHKKGYFRGEQHLEEIMFMENVTRSQLMQLLDKFKDVLITFETEDPAVAMLYPYQ